MIEHPFGWWSVLPPVVAILLAIITKRVLVSLFVGIFAGALVLTGGQPLAALEQTLQDHLWATLLDPEKLHVFAFTVLMGVMVGVINRGAGMKGLVNVVTPLASTRRRGQFVTWLLGLFVFFDDYANTMLLGNTLRPLTDRLRIAREKLAYLVDSTAAPVSGLALISTWVAGEIGYVEDGLAKLEGEVDWKAFDLFLQSIPYRFYVIWALLFVPMVALLGRDFGPMLQAERRGLEDHPDNLNALETEADPTAPAADTPARWYNAVIPVFVTVFATLYFLYTTGVASVDPATLAEASWIRRLGSIFGNADSYGSLLWGALAGAVAAYGLIVPQRLVPIAHLARAGGDGALKMLPALAILWLASALSTMTGNSGNEADAAAYQEAALVAEISLANGQSVEAIARELKQRDTSAENALRALLSLPAGEIAWEQPPADASPDRWSPSALAELTRRAGYEQAAIESAMEQVAAEPEPAAGAAGEESAETSQLTSAAIATELPYPYREYRLYTGDFLSSLLGKWLAPAWMPTIIFILSGFVAFATGTSWGTMGIVMPLVIPLVYASLKMLSGDVSPQDPVMLGAIGAVLAGAIFGDHCSPISDTTVLSSQASGCDHVAHVRTQLPYAMVVGIVSVLFGTIPIGFGFPVWLSLPIGIGVLLALLLFFGTRVEGPTDSAK